jgi:hypothetical protein
MNAPNPVPPGLTPSNSTNVSAIAAFLSASIIWALGQKQIFFPAGFEGLLCGAIAAAAGYLPASGRK